MAEVRDRYHRLGFDVPDVAPEIDDVERAYVTVALYEADTADEAGDTVSSGQVLGVAEFTRTAPADVAQRLAGIGLAVVPLGRLGDVAAGQISAYDALLLSARLDSRGPWLEGDRPVPLAHVIAAAGYLRWTPARVARQLAELGCAVPALADTAREAFIDGVDAALVEVLRDHCDTYVDRPVWRAEVLAASYRFRWTPSKIAARFAELGFTVPCKEDLAGSGVRVSARANGAGTASAGSPETA